MIDNLFFIFFLAVLLAFIFSAIIKKIAIKLNIIDRPGGERKLHEKAIPLLGGVAIFLSFFSVLLLSKNQLIAGDLDTFHWLGFFIGACFLMIGGILDDKYNIKPQYQIVWPILAVLAVVIGGVEIEKITNPFGGFYYLDSIKLPIISLGGTVFSFVVISDLVIILWLLGMMYTTKLLDGVDGLVSSVTLIGAMIIFLFTMTTKYYQPDIGLAALVLAGASAGFLILNWHPAKIFLGEAGSLFLGYALGVLAIISGGKIAIALLIMGLPMLDVVWTIIRRLRDKQNPFKFADRKHLHFRLLDIGLSQKQTVFVYLAVSGLFGLSAIFLQSLGKVVALSVLLFLMLILIVGFSLMDKKGKNKI